MVALCISNQHTSGADHSLLRQTPPHKAGQDAASAGATAFFYSKSCGWERALLYRVHSKEQNARFLLSPGLFHLN